MNIGVLWRNKRETGPVASGYLKILGQDIRIAVWKNQKRSEKDPDLTISISAPKPADQPVSKSDTKEFSDDIPF